MGEAEPIIRAENLGKKYLINHKNVKPGASLRDVLTNSLGALWGRLRQLLQRRQSETQEEFWALQDASFAVKEGEVVGIIGRNGAGKSTLLKVLSRITEPTTGRVTLNGRVASLLEVGTGFHPELTGRENVYLNGVILGMKRAEISRKFDAIVAFAEVEKFIDTPVKHFSSGMYMRLAFAVAAHLEPDILIVDEVLAVGDTAFQKKCLGKMEEVGRAGRTVLFVSHNMAALESLCSSALLLANGRVIRHGETKEVIDLYETAIKERFVAGPIDRMHYCEKAQLGIDRLEAELLPNESSGLDLIIRFRVSAGGPRRNIGAGIQILTPRGFCVSKIAPIVTNFVIEAIDGEASCSLTCPQITKYLAGGEYAIDVWLSKPRIEQLLYLENVLQISIPASDVFGAGVYFEQQSYGIVPLPFRFSVEK
jgi:lipopolysaccharide transport system ATP-binding protein